MAFENKKEAPVSMESLIEALKASSAAQIEAMMPALVAAMRAVPGASSSRQPPNHGAVCHVCGQYVKACGGKHRKVAVYPKRYPEFGLWFTGVTINGVKYLSNNGGHAIPVPENAADSVNRMVADFEESERVARLGRKIVPSTNTITVETSSTYV